MDGPGFDSASPADPEWEAADEPAAGTEGLEFTTPAEDISLEDLAVQLERDPGECWRAFEGLESIDVETRLKIIEGLAGLSPGPGVVGLLELLASEGDERSRTAALKAIATLNPVNSGSGTVEIASGPAEGAGEAEERGLERIHDGAGGSRELVRLGEDARPLLVDCLVTAVDGAGRGAIGLSASKDARRITALFHCDVERGVLGAIGQIEEESAQAGGLLREIRAQAAGPGVENAKKLALGLLAGELLLCGPSVPEPVSHWLEQTLGSGLEPRALPVPTARWFGEPMGNADLLLGADEILEVCPTWLDSSALTFELAEEIVLREGWVAVDPRRDSGAFRFLFEHRIIHRLEHYSRMLLWMSRFWESGGEPDLARSAQTLAAQLSDEQYAVPSHPFAVALTARSLNVAQARLGTSADPRAVQSGR